MNIKTWATAVVVLVAMAPETQAERVVGFSNPRPGTILAQRIVLHKGDRVTSIKFYSNDNTTFPQVHLALDSRGKYPPQPGLTLSLVNNVEAEAGYTEVEIAPYTSPANQYAWVVVVLPEEPIETRGVGGGAGIGLLDEPLDARSRSIYGTEGALGWYRNGALDIHPVLAGTQSGKARRAGRNQQPQFTISARSQSRVGGNHILTPGPDCRTNRPDRLQCSWSPSQPTRQWRARPRSTHHRVAWSR